MFPNPDLIHYACIARGTTLLAELNYKDASLAAVAARCLDQTPPFHAEFTHTVRSRTHVFLVDDPLVYFAIFDARLANSEGLAFLRSVRDAFGEVFKVGKRRLERLTSHCFQGEFNPVFRHLLGPALYRVDGLGSPTRCVNLRPKPNGEKAVNRMKNMLFVGKIRMGMRNDESGGGGAGLGREFLLKNGELIWKAHHKAHKVWKKHVLIVFS